MNTESRTATAAHTPGPWTLDDPNADYVSKRGGHGFRPLRVKSKDDQQIAYCGDQTDNLADARVIAAAPDLMVETEASAATFEGVARALEFLGDERLAELGFTDMKHDCVARAKASRAAIAKATGAA